MPVKAAPLARTTVRAPSPALVGATQGAIFVEYAVVVGFVGLVLALGLSLMGPRVVAEYSARRATLYSHSP